MSSIEPLSSRLLSGVPTVRHGMTTRHGGVSDAPYDTLNMGLHVGDVYEAVLENRRRACLTLGFALDDWVSGEQVHGAKVARVSAEHRGSGGVAHAASLSGVDGLITDTPGILLAGYFADCVPVLVVDPNGPCIGIGHAGWRGTLGNVASRLVREMAAAFGSSPDDLLVWIGPAIGACCFHVSRDVAERFSAAGLGAFVREKPTLTIDLSGVNRHAFITAGVAEQHIEVSNECTACNTERFFSHRAQGPQTGRMAALLGIVEA